MQNHQFEREPEPSKRSSSDLAILQLSDYTLSPGIWQISPYLEQLLLHLSKILHILHTYHHHDK